MMLLQCSLGAATARACLVKLTQMYRTGARDQASTLYAHAQCYMWSQLLRNCAKSLSTEHGARGHESAGWENLVGAILLISPHQFSGEGWNHRAIECKQTCSVTPLCLPEVEDKNSRTLHSLLWDGNRVRELNASKWTAYTTSSLFSFQTLLQTKQNSNSTMLGTNPKIGQIDLLRDVIVNKTRSLPSNTLKTHKLWQQGQVRNNKECWKEECLVHRLPTQIYMHQANTGAGKQPAKMKQAGRVWVDPASWTSNPKAFSTTSGSIQMTTSSLDGDDDNNGNDDVFGSWCNWKPTHVCLVLLDNSQLLQS